MAKKLIVVVVYGRGADDSETLVSLCANQDGLQQSDLFVWDNSARSELSEDILRKLFPKVPGIFFRHDSGNKGLSGIYNHIIDTHRNSYDYFTWLDHDTVITGQYLDEMNSVTDDAHHSEKLILPRVLSAGRIVSPGRLVYFFGSYFKKLDPGRRSSRFLTAINSGMIIATTFFQITGFRYDEGLSFYGTDNDFMQTYSRNEPFCRIMEAQLQHSLDYYDPSESIEKKAKRFEQNMHSVIYLHRKQWFAGGLSYLYVFFRSLAECARHRSMKFFYY